jgi:cytoskeleton protein RodZ
LAKATGIGPVLRRARLQRGKSIGEASRETRIRAEYLQALERERFDNLLGDVYVRGFLRSYSSYLGLDSEKVVSIYSQHFGPPSQPRPPVAPAPTATHPRRHWQHGSGGFLARIPMPTLRGRRLTWPVLLVVAAIVVGVLATTGLFSPSNTAPAAASGATLLAPVDLGSTVTIAVEATVDVHTTITADGHVRYNDVLRAGEGVSVQAEHVIQIRMDRGASARITVDGRDLGEPGSSTQPYRASFRAAVPRSQPSVGPSVG